MMDSLFRKQLRKNVLKSQLLSHLNVITPFNFDMYMREYIYCPGCNPNRIAKWDVDVLEYQKAIRGSKNNTPDHFGNFLLKKGSLAALVDLYDDGNYEVSKLISQIRTLPASGYVNISDVKDRHW